jgi:hypothetical protein
MLSPNVMVSDADLQPLPAESEAQDPREAEEKFVRWAPVAVPLSGGAILAAIALIWSAVL